MNLVIDLGNTFFKFAFFKEDKIIDVGIFQKNDSRSISKFIRKHKDINAAIISTVVSYPSELSKLLKGINNQLVFSSKTKIPLKNLYKTPQTLGNDRLAAAVGANHFFPEKNVLVIDAGTCIKYNFVNSKGEYLGGAISPGIAMRFRALHQYTDRLPLIEADYAFDELIGQTSKDSILSGVLNGVIEETDGIIKRYKKQYSNLKVITTGGNGAFFEKRLKNSIFAHPYLVLKGLNVILNYNAKEKGW